MRQLTQTGKKINSKIGKAIHDYGMISDGDKILVAVSGGKDSLALLALLSKIQTWAPVKFTLFAAHITSDYAGIDKEHIKFLKGFFKELGVTSVFRKIKIVDKKREVTCFWCSWNRRKALFEIADELGCGKVALGHHKDDIVETMLMNLLYNGEFSAMNPKQEMFGGKLTLIRPLCYVDEKMTAKFSRENDFPSFTCKCPAAVDSRRKFIKDFIRQAGRLAPKMDIRTNIFRSIARVREEYIQLKEE